MCLPSLLAFTSLWCLHYPLLRSTQVLQKSCQGNFRKFQGSGKSRFGGSGKDQYFLKIPKWQYKHFLDYKWRKLVSYFLNNVAKTCLYGINISENIDIEHVFQCKVFFCLSSNHHTSCLSAFKILLFCYFWLLLIPLVSCLRLKIVALFNELYFYKKRLLELSIINQEIFIPVPYSNKTPFLKIVYFSANL